MNNRVAMIGIIVEESDSSAQVNAVLHEYADYVVGRMGIPYRARGVQVISLVVDAPLDVVNSVTGKLGMIKGISAKTVLSKI